VPAAQGQPQVGDSYHCAKTAEAPARLGSPDPIVDHYRVRKGKLVLYLFYLRHGTTFQDEGRAWKTYFASTYFRAMILYIQLQLGAYGRILQ